MLIGSGNTAENVEQLLSIADGTIIASYFKSHGKWQYKVDKERVNKFINSVKDFINSDI